MRNPTAIRLQHFLLATRNLGPAYEMLGDNEKTKDVVERVLKIFEQHYGQDHFAVAKALENLGAAYGNLGDYDMTKKFFERAVNIKVKHFCEDYVDVATILHNLAVAHVMLGIELGHSTIIAPR